MQVQSFLSDVLSYVEELGTPEGLSLAPVKNMGILHKSKRTNMDCGIVEPVVSLVLQGRKKAFYGTRTMDYGTGDLLVVGQTMPVLSSVITPSPDKPFVAVFVTVDMPILRNLYSEIGPGGAEDDAPHGMDAGQADPELIDAMGRLFRLGRDPVAERALGAATLREVYFRILRSPQAGALRQILQIDSKTSRVAKAIAHIHQQFRAPLKASDLAEIAGMSVSVFYESFRQVTSSSPLQFQKDLRLLEAHKMLLLNRNTVSDIAFSVGYESPAQFSREFTRKFGAPPSAIQRAEVA